MGLFTPKELGKKVSCMYCGKKYFLTKSAGQVVQSIPTRVPGYSMAMVAVCSKCGKAACITGGCYNRGCKCGNIRFDQEIAFHK